MLMPGGGGGGGGTERRRFEPRPSGFRREFSPRVGGEWGSGFFFEIYVSENAFQAILKLIFPSSIISILSKVRHSNTLFFAINFAFPCHPLGALVWLCFLL